MKAYTMSGEFLGDFAFPRDKQLFADVLRALAGRGETGVSIHGEFAEGSGGEWPIDTVLALLA